MSNNRLVHVVYRIHSDGSKENICGFQVVDEAEKQVIYLQQRGYEIGINTIQLRGTMVIG